MADLENARKAKIKVSDLRPQFVEESQIGFAKIEQCKNTLCDLDFSLNVYNKINKKEGRKRRTTRLLYMTLFIYEHLSQ